jgi:hypothetical protein
LFSRELEKGKIKQQVEKTFKFFTNLLFYKMARPERLLGAMPLAPSGPPSLRDDVLRR